MQEKHLSALAVWRLIVQRSFPFLNSGSTGLIGSLAAQSTSKENCFQNGTLNIPHATITILHSNSKWPTQDVAAPMEVFLGMDHASRKQGTLQPCRDTSKQYRAGFVFIKHRIEV